MTYNRKPFCPVIYGLISRASSLTLMRYPAWAKAVARATTELANQMK